ncbi:MULTISPECIES: phage holin family protein [Moraxella]|uniref:Phage holin family protein n=1 Tax=Moraxella catarrhalis TaxID=480 RepID=A0A7Z0UXP9_MORCA|nr:phage holin family protein [Moraxella catarrhalis]OAV00215.1 hypothetical protein AO382_1365 [Moraxella catarrhalis]STY82483.1 Protein of uncharacterised function (DUF754) [Moraxella catarrhalis]
MFEFIAILLNVAIGARLTWFERGEKRHSRRHALLAALMIAASLAHAVYIGFISHSVTLFELVFSAIFAYLVWQSKGNVARLWEV